MKVFDVLNPHVKIEGPIFLEAAAGCGKTFAIEHIIARMLIQNGISFDECLVVTFTKAAALDLKKRIFQTLTNIEKSLISGEVSSLNLPYLNGDQKKDEVLRLVQAAIEKVNQAMISTIHGFCFNFLTEQAYFVNLPLSSQETISMTDFVMDCLRAMPHDSFPAIWMKQFHKGLETLDDSITKVLVPYLGYNLDIEQKITFQEFFSQFIGMTLELKSSVKNESWDDYLGFLSCVNGLYTKDKEIKYPLELDFIKSLPFLDGISLDVFVEFLNSREFIEQILHGKIAKKHEKDSLIIHKLESLRALLNPFYELIQKSLNKGNIVLNLLEFCQIRLKKELLKQPLAHPDFLLKQMQEAINDPLTISTLRKKYKAVLIDEFQDTDPIQWNIFEKAFFGAYETKLFVCVGDPKQSIYGFRNADLNTYLKAKERFTEDNCYILDTNFRSEKKLIEALNDCFLANQEIGFFHFEPYPLKIDYFPIKAKHEKLWSPSDKKLGLHYPLFSGKTINQIEEELVFPYLAAEVISLINQGISIDQIAFLVKDRYQGQKLKTVLEKKGFSFDSLKTDLLIEKDSYFLMESVLEFLTEIQSDQAFKKILFHPYIRKEDYLDQQFIDHGYLKIKQELLEKFEDEPKIRTLSKFIEIIFSHLKIFETILRKKNFQAYDELIQFLEIILQESTKKASLQELYYCFYEYKNKNPNELENLKKRSSSSNKSPTIITMHSSKGLEYDIVFVLGLYSESIQDPILYRKEEDEEKKWGWKKSSKADLHLIAEDMERMRQFYVALTRAKKRAYLPILIEEGEDYSSKKSLSPSLLYMKKAIYKISDHSKLYQLPLEAFAVEEYLKKKSIASFEKVTTVADSFYENSVIEPIKKIQPPTSFSYSKLDKKIVSFSSIAEHKETKKIETDDKQSKGALFGNFFHALIEKLIEERFYEKTESEEFKNWLKKRIEFTPFEAEFEEIYEMIHLTMQAKLIDGKYAIKDLPYQCVMPEMKMQIKLKAPHLEMKGFLDLLIHFDGKWTIIDFKTNFLGLDKSCYEQENLKKAISEKEYDLQAACYTKALKTFHKLQQTTGFSQSFQGVSFVFVRGLRFGEGIITLNEKDRLEEIFEDDVLSRT